MTIILVLYERVKCEITMAGSPSGPSINASRPPSPSLLYPTQPPLTKGRRDQRLNPRAVLAPLRCKKGRADSSCSPPL